MFIAEKHGNVWMVVRRNSEGIVGTVKSFARQAAAERLAVKLNALLTVRLRSWRRMVRQMQCAQQPTE